MKTTTVSYKKKIEKLKSYIKKKKDDEYYINEQHKKLCEYRDKYLELQKKLELREITYEIKYKKINSKKKEEDKIILYYNDYNKKFINKLYDNIEIENLNKIIENNDIFLLSLDKDEIDTIRYYTYYGDTLINQFIKGLFSIEWLKDTYNDYEEETPFILKDENNNKLFIFNKQIYEYYKTDDWKYENLLKKTNKEIFLKYYSIKDYNPIFISYIKDLMKIFNKAPKLTSKLIVYRGIKDDYHVLNKKEDIFVNKLFSSTTFLFDVAYRYLDKKKGIMQRITIDKGIPILFLEGITLNTGEYEILLPINTYYIIENPVIKTIPIYPSSLKNINKPIINNIICKTDNVSEIKVSDLHLIGYTKSLKYIENIKTILR
jgi:hypothetical protein